MSSGKVPDLSESNYDLFQFGVSYAPDAFDPNRSLCDEDNENYSDLEAELAVITHKGNSAKPKSDPKPNPAPATDFDQMIAECLKDVTDGQDDSDAENDSELLGELQDIVGNLVDEGKQEPRKEECLLTTDLKIVDVLKKRIEMYKIAEANAKSANEHSKMRRFNRGLKTLNDLLKQTNSGKIINLEDIPPKVSVKISISDNIMDVDHKENKCSAIPVIETESISKEQEETKSGELLSSKLQVNPLVLKIRSLQQDYKDATLQLKRDKHTVMALQFFNIVKQCDVVLKMLEDGQDVDLNMIPPPPDRLKKNIDNMAAESKPANLTALTISSQISADEHSIERNINKTNILGALIERLNKYKSVEESAKAETNYSKARRYGRIVKQYEDAIEAHKAGRLVSYNELPVPPGFERFSVETIKSEPSSLTAICTTSETPGHFDLTTRTLGNQHKNNLAEKQMKILLERQNEFKIAAIEAKKAGEIKQAKEYLRIKKGFDALLNAASSGLPVNFNTLPVPPAHRADLAASFDIVTTEDCEPNDDISDIGDRIETQLAKQLMICKNTRDHHKALGDIAGMNCFEKLALTVQKDLDLVRYSKRNNFALPKFLYEKRSFNVVHCNTDLNDNELEIIVVRGIKYNVSNPKDVDTYVKVEFPLLNNEIFRTKTSLVKDTDSPNYDQHYKVEILRGNRQFHRIFKRQSAKFEVYSRGGFLRSDTQIGCVKVKLQALETKCDIHDTFDLVEGRKKIGGKLEIKLRVRNPILTKEMERIDEKWLVTDI